MIGHNDRWYSIEKDGLPPEPKTVEEVYEKYLVTHWCECCIDRGLKAPENYWMSRFGDGHWDEAERHLGRVTHWRKVEGLSDEDRLL